MCTAISFNTKDHYFGRTLDLSYSYSEQVVITPRGYRLGFRNGEELKRHYAMIGMATVADGYPLYYEAANEAGLAAAGLNFPDSAHYQPADGSKHDVAPFEFIPWILGSCQNIAEAKTLLGKTNIIDMDFSPELTAAPLHWIISDGVQSITVEAVSSGLAVYDNPLGVLTNEPPFEWHLTNLSNYINLTAELPDNRFSDKFTLNRYSKGMGAIGLPGDLSSASRFVRAAFTKLNSVCGETEEKSVTQFFHILNTVSQTRGSVHEGEGKYTVTVYTSCINTDRGVYYYTSYQNSQITAVDMRKENLDSETLIAYRFITDQQIKKLN